MLIRRHVWPVDTASYGVERVPHVSSLRKVLSIIPSLFRIAHDCDNDHHNSGTDAYSWKEGVIRMAIWEGTMLDV